MVERHGGQKKKQLPVRTRHYSVSMSNGEYLQVYTPSSKDIKTYNTFPNPVGTKGDRSFYRETSLPADLRGVYFSYTDSEGNAKIIHSILNDPGLLRYASDGLMPIVWWGSIKQISDNSLVAGVYPTYYLNNQGGITEGGVSFYSSADYGGTWNLLGKIPFVKDGIADVKGNSSYDEPAFEVLRDGTFICVMRSGSTSPMYISSSLDKGKSWTKPQPFTPNGVKPQLLALKNNLLVLTSGRPGVQLRFCLDGLGEEWTEPIDMVPFMNGDGSYLRDVSCGYTSLIELGRNSFLLVWSDFTTRDSNGNIRKSIWCRKVKIKRY